MTSIIKRIKKNPIAPKPDKKTKFYKKKWFIALAVFLFFGIIFGSYALYKTGHTLNVISDKDESAFSSLLGLLGGGAVAQEEDGRINIMLLGMRGKDVPGGGLLADTIMIVSIKPDENKMAMISVPRDLYVKAPGNDSHTKINAVYALGENNGKKKGLAEMKDTLGMVTGLKIHYGAVINFEGFRKLIDAVGGINVNLETDFYETNQFVQGNECGGQFHLTAGDNLLDGEKALCYVRARENTSDFDRAKRQQLVLQKLKDKMVSMGTLTSFSKVNAILDAVGENVRTDMTSSEMRKFYEEYSDLQDAQVHRRVFENTPDGMLKVPEDSPDGAGYILIPRAGWDNYSEIQEVCQTIFTLPPQTDIDPMKQSSKPASTKKPNGNNDANANQSEEADEGKKDIRTTVEIIVTGELPLADGLKYTMEQKIDAVELKGEYEDDAIEINLDDFDEVTDSDDFGYKIGQLEDEIGYKIAHYHDKETVLKFDIKKKENENEEDEDDE